MSARKITVSTKVKLDLPIGIRYLEHQLKLANEFRFPKFEKWEVNFRKLNAIQDDNKNWSSLKIFKELERNKDRPAIYYFSSSENFTPEIFKSFRVLKRKSLNGFSDSECYNICKVPGFSETSCLYVGSVKEELVI
jgi:hypothetical protein